MQEEILAAFYVLSGYVDTIYKFRTYMKIVSSYKTHKICLFNQDFIGVLVLTGLLTKVKLGLFVVIKTFILYCNLTLDDTTKELITCFRLYLLKQ